MWQLRGNSRVVYEWPWGRAECLAAVSFLYREGPVDWLAKRGLQFLVREVLAKGGEWWAGQADCEAGDWVNCGCRGGGQRGAGIRHWVSDQGCTNGHWVGRIRAGCEDLKDRVGQGYEGLRGIVSDGLCSVLNRQLRERRRDDWGAEQGQLQRWGDHCRRQGAERRGPQETGSGHGTGWGKRRRRKPMDGYRGVKSFFILFSLSFLI